jgi:putative oxidoreductase
MFVAHALLKVLVFTPAGTVKFFESIGLPGPLAYATIVAELVGGALILAGNGWLFTAPNGSWEYPAFLTVAALVQSLLGDGGDSSGDGCGGGCGH